MAQDVRLSTQCAGAGIALRHLAASRTAANRERDQSSAAQHPCSIRDLTCTGPKSAQASAVLKLPAVWHPCSGMAIAS